MIFVLIIFQDEFNPLVLLANINATSFAYSDLTVIKTLVSRNLRSFDNENKRYDSSNLPAFSKCFEIEAKFLLRVKIFYLKTKNR